MNKYLFGALCFFICCIVAILCGWIFRNDLPWNLYKANRAAENYMYDTYGKTLKAKYSFCPIIDDIAYNVIFEEDDLSFKVYVTPSKFTVEWDDYVPNYAEKYMDKIYKHNMEELVKNDMDISFNIQYSLESNNYHESNKDVDDSKLYDIEYYLVIQTNEEIDDEMAEDILRLSNFIREKDLNVYGIDLYDKEDLYMIHDVKKLTDVESIKKELEKD